MQDYISAEKALRVVKSGDKVFMHGGAATPAHLIRTLMKRAHELHDVELLSISTYGEGLFKPETMGDSFFLNVLFVSKSARETVNSEHGDYVPVFLHEIPKLFERGILIVDVALIHVSPPDERGFCSLGVSVDIARSVLRFARHIIAQVNPKMPHTYGDGSIHISEIHDLVEVRDDLPEVNYANRLTQEDILIGRNCAELIEDRSTLQLGIGSIPDAVLAQLEHHKDLGLHTEMFSDGVISLVKSGVITNAYKKKHCDKIVTGFAVGTRKLYDFVDDNPLVVFYPISYVNDPFIIRQNPRVCAINSAIEVDITGQVCADSIGTYQYSGVGGQVDFMRGAAASEGGKPIIAMHSITSHGESKIVPVLKRGAGVVSTRADVHYVVTEYGVADLFGKNLSQRAQALLQIAHPSHRENLDREIFERLGNKFFYMAFAGKS